MVIPVFDLASSLLLMLLGHAVRNQLRSACTEPLLFPHIAPPFMPGYLVPPRPADQPRIPVELLEEIVDFLEDSNEGLRSISGVSKMFAARARPFLFKNIDILSFKRLIQLAPLLSSKHCTIPTTASRLVLRFESPRPGKKSAYKSEAVIFALGDIFEHFEGFHHTIWLDFPAVVSRNLDWTYLHRFSSINSLVVCGTYTWLPGLLILLRHLPVLETLVIEAHFTCDSNLNYYDEANYLSPRLKEIVLSPSTLRMMRWMCGLTTLPHDLHTFRVNVDSNSSSRHLFSYIDEFLKHYRKIAHLYVWFQEDDPDLVEGLGEALYFAPHVRQVEMLFPGPLDEEETDDYVRLLRQYAWSRTAVRGRGGSDVGIDLAEFWEVPSYLVNGKRLSCIRRVCQSPV